MILYSNGCSYTHNNWVEPAARYPALIAKHFDWQLQDAGIPGSCNDRILRCTMRDCIKLKEAGQEVVALVQLTHPHRTEYAGTPTENTAWKYAIDDKFESIKPADETQSPEVNNYMKLWLYFYNKPAEIEKLRSNIIGLVAFFKENNIQYYVYNGPEELMSTTNDIFYQYLYNDTRVLDLAKFNMLALTGNQAHSDIQGMRAIADYFIELFELK